LHIIPIVTHTVSPPGFPCRALKMHASGQTLARGI
jgi:hypothetical protein